MLNAAKQKKDETDTVLKQAQAGYDWQIKGVPRSAVRGPTITKFVNGLYPICSCPMPA